MNTQLWDGLTKVASETQYFNLHFKDTLWLIQIIQTRVIDQARGHDGLILTDFFSPSSSWTEANENAEKNWSQFKAILTKQA